LARQWDVRLAGLPPDTSPTLRTAPVPQAALRYALLNVLGVAIPRAAGGAVQLTGEMVDEIIAVDVDAAQAQGSDPLSDEERASLEVARQLIEVAGGELTAAAGADGFRARLALPVLEQVRVLVVDDNADTLQLFARYAVGTRYAVTAMREPAGALRLAEELEPDIIILDVMMPDLDGWEMLARLREQTRHEPDGHYHLHSAAAAVAGARIGRERVPAEAGDAGGVPCRAGRSGAPVTMRACGRCE